MPCAKLVEYLEDNHVDYELKEHPNAYAAQDVAFKSGVPGRRFAKTVLVKLDGEMAMAVLPADSKVDFPDPLGPRRSRLSPRARRNSSMASVGFVPPGHV